MNQADLDLFQYADEPCLVYLHKNVKEIAQKSKQNFSNICDWFVGNKLSIILEMAKQKVCY